MARLRTDRQTNYGAGGHAHAFAAGHPSPEEVYSERYPAVRPLPKLPGYLTARH